MKRAAIGARMHSGWGALVAVSNSAGVLEVIERRRLAVTAPGTAGAIQPYHFAKNLGLGEAEKFLGNCFATSKGLALAAIHEVAGELGERDYHVVGAGVLLASGRPLPELSKILASHAAIHTAEGQFFREVFTKACEEMGLAVTGFPERDLDQAAQKTFGKEAARVRRQFALLGRAIGPPWTKDQKTAALAALMVLERSQRDGR
jgi:hypothetical protein